jgi:dihydrofolate synthase/folylpolyglutamate synthase
LEVVGRRPLTIVDGAHNVAGMTALAAAVAEEFAVDGEVVAVIGMLRGRDPSAMLAALGPARVRTLVACAPDSPRALPAPVVAEAGRALGMSVSVAGSVAEAVSVGRGVVSEDGLLLVAGSLYVVTDARQVLLEGASRP